MNSTTAQAEGTSPSAQAASLEFRDATKRYPGTERIAVEALSLEVPAGEICVLVGPSGCGKTTAMRMVNRMIEISDGDILVGGESVRTKRARPAAARDRLRDPADRAVPAQDDRRQHRHRARPAGLGQEAHRRRASRSCSS